MASGEIVNYIGVENYGLNTSSCLQKQVFNYQLCTKGFLLGRLRCPRIGEFGENSSAAKGAAWRCGSECVLDPT